MNAATATPVPLRTKLLFGCGQAVEAGVSFAANTFLLYYLTNVCKIAASTAGTLIFVSLLIDAIADPLIGSASDRWRSRWGRRLPFMLLGLPVLAAGTLGVFVAPATGSGATLIAWVLAFNLLLRLGTSLFAMPYAALTAEISSDYNERSSIAVHRCLFGFLGSVAIVAPAFGLVFAAPDAMNSPAAYRELGWLTTGAVLVFGGACVIGLLRGGHARPMLPPADAATRKSPLADLRDLARNRSFVLLFAASTVCLVGVGSLNALNLYAYRDFWHLQPAQMQWPQLALQIGLVAGIPVAALSLQRFEKHRTLIAAMAMLTLFQGLGPLLVLAVAAPPAALVLAILGASSLVLGACCSMVFVAFQAMVADAIDEHELKFGARCEGLYYSALVFAAKAAAGLGSMLAGLALTLLGPQPEHNAMALGLVWGPGHALVFAATLPLLMAYKLDRRRHAQIRAALAGAA